MSSPLDQLNAAKSDSQNAENIAAARSAGLTVLPAPKPVTEEEKEKRNKIAELLGYIEVPVTMPKPGLDGNPVVQNVRVRYLNTRELAIYSTVKTDPSALVELFTGNDQGWADQFRFDVVENLLSEGERINRPFYEKLVERQLKAITEAMDEASRNPDVAAFLAKVGLSLR